MFILKYIRCPGKKKGKQKIIFLTKRKLPNKERTLFNAVIVLRYKINIQAGKKK